MLPGLKETVFRGEVRLGRRDGDTRMQTVKGSKHCFLVCLSPPRQRQQGEDTGRPHANARGRRSVYDRLSGKTARTLQQNWSGL